MRAPALALAAALAAAPARAAERLVFRGDARVDLTAAVQRLAGDGGFGLLGPTTPLGREGLARLRGEKSARAVALARKLAARGFSGRFPLQYALYLSSAPGFPEAWPVPDLFVRAAGGRAALDEWRAALSDLDRDAGFTAWRASRAAEFDALADQARDASAGTDLEGALVSFLGFRPWERIEILSSPFVVPDRGAWWVLENAARPTIAAILGPRRAAPRFGTPAEFAADVWSEPLSYAGYVAVDACRGAAPWAADVCAGIPDPGSPEDCAERLWLEAATSLLHARTFGAGREARSEKRAEKMRDYAPALAAMKSFAARSEGDWLSWAPRLSAPLLSGGKVPACPFPDPTRKDDPLYRARMGAVEAGRLERGGEAK